MSVLDKKVKDKIGYEWNVFTDDLDIVNKFNANRIVTAEYNAAGTKNMTYDQASGTQIDASFQIVTDEFGNVVVI